jgi:hypothetical protein
LRVLREVYGRTCIKDFGPLTLKTVRTRMLSLPSGICKGTGVTLGQRPSRKRGDQTAKKKDAKNAQVSRPCGKCEGKKILGWSRGNVNVSVAAQVGRFSESSNLTHSRQSHCCRSRRLAAG